MMDRKIALVAPYFGKFPAHFQLWLNSCAANPQIMWLLYTDDRTQWKFPSNVIVTYCTLSDLRERFQKKFNFEISLSGIKKLGDYKPLYGYLFEEELKGYFAWGHIDLGDVIYGDFSHFVTEDLISKYDRLGYLGHLTIYQNTLENNRRFMADSGAGFNYRDVLSSPKFYNFEELAVGSIDNIWRKNGWSTGLLCEGIADLRAVSWAFWMRYKYGDVQKMDKDRYLIFEWDRGRLFGHQMTPSGEIVSREYLYVHFKRRPMPIDPEINEQRYVIAPGGFISAPSEIDADYLKKYGKGKFPDPLWLRAKWAGIKVRLGID